jgi:hypothetical protein
VKLALGVVGLLASVALHAVWNLSALYGGATLKATYVFVMVPVFALGLLIIALEIRREGRVVADQLLRELQAGRLTSAEHARLVSVAARDGRPLAGAATRRIRGLAGLGAPPPARGELALLRQRIAAGVRRRG